MPLLARFTVAVLIPSLSYGCSTPNKANHASDSGVDGGTDTDTDVDVDELCNGVDDDGDGETDEEVVDCEGFDGCHVGQCVWFCEEDGTGNDNLCPTDYVCVRVHMEWVCAIDVCNPDLPYVLPCVENPYWCNEGFVPPCECELFYDLCADSCFGLVCPDGYVCVPRDGGSCHPIDENCYVAGCPTGEICAGGVCVDNPCTDVTCDPGYYCNADGNCVSPCIDIDCPTSCFEGECVDDPCAGVVCEGFFECVDGDCIQANCWGVVCEFWEVCADGDCVDDPCWNIDCPNGFMCIGGGCYEYEAPAE